MASSITVDIGRCQGHGRCIIECPEAFDSDEQGYVVVTLDSLVPKDLEQKVAYAIDSCPEHALSLSEKG